MRALCVLLTLLLPSAAFGFAAPRSGLWLDATVGGALTAAPVRAGPEWAARVGIWHGPYDDAYAIGRFWGVAVGARQWFGEGGPYTAPMLEVRRGIDVLVAKPWAGVTGGPVFARDGLAGGTVRALAGVKYRPHRFVGPIVQVEAGADLGETTRAHFALVVGVEWARPFRDEPERPAMPVTPEARDTPGSSP